MQQYKYNDKNNSPSTNLTNDRFDRFDRFPVVIVLNQPIAHKGEKLAWLLATIKANRKQKEMCCSPPVPAAERIQIAGRTGWGTQSNTVIYLNYNRISY